MLGAIESLLSAVVADGMTGSKHDPDAELIAQGIGNIVAPFFGGFAATGAIARTATNIRAGARSPFAAVVHAVFVLLAVLLLAPLLGRLPMASLAALLLLVAWNMSELDHFAHVLQGRAAARRRRPADLLRPDRPLRHGGGGDGGRRAGGAPLHAADGGGLARSASWTSTRSASTGRSRRASCVYEIAGPLFFGAAQKAMAALEEVDKGVRVVLLDLRSVPAIDATGLVGLESAFERLNRAGVLVVIGGAQSQPLRTMARAGWTDRHGRVAVYGSFERAVDEVRKAFE